MSVSDEVACRGGGYTEAESLAGDIWLLIGLVGDVRSLVRLVGESGIVSRSLIWLVGDISLIRLVGDT